MKAGLFVLIAYGHSCKRNVRKLAQINYRPVLYIHFMEMYGIINAGSVQSDMNSSI